MASRRLDLEISTEGLDELLKGFQRNLFALNNLKFGIQSFGAIANGTFQSLVGSSIQLEQQLISIRGALAATNDIQRFGKSISDPLERINKLAPSVNKAIAQVRKDSLELANVTSDDLIGVFQIISGEVGNIGANLDDAAKLTKAFGSSFSALGLPLAGARQEIVSILQGTIDQNSALAKTLAINNTQIQQEKAKGTLVEFLLKRTEALAASQGLVAKTFGGVSSNILEIFQRLQESFGKVVLPPVVEQLTKIYNNLLAVQPQIEAFISNTSKGFIEIASNLKLGFDAIVPLFVEFGKTLGAIATASLPVLQAGFTFFLGTAIAVANTLTVVLTPILQTLQSDFGKFAVTVGLVAIAFNKAIPIVLTFAGQVLNTLLGSLAVVTAAFTGQLGVVAGFNAFILGSNGAAIAAKLLGGTLGALGASVAVLAGGIAIAAAAFIAYSKASESAKQTNEAFANSTNVILGLNTQLEKSITSLQDKQKKGTITPQEVQTLQGLLKLYKQGTQDIDAQIKEQEDIIKTNGLGSALGVSADQTIKRLQDQKAKIQQFFDETAILGQKAIAQGTIQEQFNTVSDNFFTELKNGTQLAVTQAKGFIGVLQQEIELGVRSKESGLERLKALSDAEFLLKEDRVAAAKAATAIIDKENKLQVASVSAREAEIKSQIDSGALFEIDGIKKISELKEQSKNLEIAAIDEKLKFVQAGSDLERELVTQRAKAIAELNDLQIESTQKQVQILRGNLERELQSNTQLRLQAEQALQADLLALRLGGFENEFQLQEQSLQQAKRNNDAELFDKQRQLEFDKTLLANFVGGQKEREELILKIGATESEIAKLQLAQTQNLIDRYKLLQEVRVKTLEIEKEGNGKVLTLLQSQNDLLQAQVKLEASVADAQIKGADNRLSALKEAQKLLGSTKPKQVELTFNETLKSNATEQEKAAFEERKKRFEEEQKAIAAKRQADEEELVNNEKKRLTIQRLSELGISAGTNELTIARQIFDQEQKLLELKARRFEAEQSAARSQLEIQIQQSQIRDRQLNIESQIALVKATATGDKSQIDAALALVNLSKEQIANNEKIAGLQRQSLTATQKAELDSFNQEQGKAAFESRIQGAEQGLKGLQSSGLIRAGVTGDRGISSTDQAKGILSKDVQADRDKLLKQRAQDIGSESVAFKDTSAQIADNFDRLPKSLAATKKALQDVVGASKELADNPLLKDRTEQGKKQQAASDAAAKAQQSQQAQRSQLESAKADLGLSKFVNANPAISGSSNNNKLSPSDSKFQGDVLNAIPSAFGASGTAAQIKSRFPFLTDAQVQILAFSPESDAAKEILKIIDDKLNPNRRKSSFELNKSRTVKRFTGGFVDANIPATVNERGQEAVTNLNTLETSLLPNGERTVEFDAPAWVHNASETKQLGSLGVFDPQMLPNLNFGAIAATLRIGNDAVVRELKQLRSELAASMSRPNQVLSPVFNNVERPDLQMYRLQQQLLRT